MSNVIIETSEEEPIVAVCRYVGNISKNSGFAKECEALLASGRHGEVIGKVAGAHSKLFADGSEKDVESVFSIICNLASKLPAADADAAAEKIAAAVASEAGDKSLVKMRVLFGLYNVMEASNIRYAVFMHIIAFARKAEMADAVLPALKRVESWATEWGLGADESRKLFLACSNFLRDFKPASRGSFTFLLSYLATFENEPASALTAVREEAVRAAVEFLKSSDNFQCDLLDMATIKVLEKDSKYSGLYRLLSIFLTERLQRFLDYCSENPSLLDGYGLVYDDCVSKMRLMSLAALASESGTGEIEYATVRDTLMVKDDEVEEWVVKAISLKLVDAKMDQLRGVIVVSRATQRVFARPQWEELRSKLASWRENVSGVTRKVAATRSAVPQGLQPVY